MRGYPIINVLHFDTLEIHYIFSPHPKTYCPFLPHFTYVLTRFIAVLNYHLHRKLLVLMCPDVKLVHVQENFY